MSKKDKKKGTVTKSRQGRPKRPGKYQGIGCRLPVELYNVVMEIKERTGLSFTDILIVATLMYTSAKQDKRDDYWEKASKMEYVFQESLPPQKNKKSKEVPEEKE